MKTSLTPIGFDGVCHWSTDKSKINSLYFKRLKPNTNGERWMLKSDVNQNRKWGKKKSLLWSFCYLTSYHTHKYKQPKKMTKWSRKHQTADASVGAKRANSANLLPWRHFCVPELFLFSSAEICKGAVSVSLTGHWTVHGRDAAAEQFLQSFGK